MAQNREDFSKLYESRVSAGNCYCYITVDFATAASQNDFCASKLYFH
jgi:hypothetical protein